MVPTGPTSTLASTARPVCPGHGACRRRAPHAGGRVEDGRSHTDATGRLGVDDAGPAGHGWGWRPAAAVGAARAPPWPTHRGQPTGWRAPSEPALPDPGRRGPRRASKRRRPSAPAVAEGAPRLVVLAPATSLGQPQGVLVRLGGRRRAWVLPDTENEYEGDASDERVGVLEPGGDGHGVVQVCALTAPCERTAPRRRFPAPAPVPWRDGCSVAVRDARRRRRGARSGRWARAYGARPHNGVAHQRDRAFELSTDRARRQ